MSRLRAHARDGRLILDEPTALPEGTVLDLVVDDEGDDLEPAEREALHAAIDRAMESVLAGRVQAAETILD